MRELIATLGEFILLAILLLFAIFSAIIVVSFLYGTIKALIIITIRAFKSNNNSITLYLIGIMVEANLDFREWNIITRWGFVISFLMLLDYSDDKKLLEWLKTTIKTIYMKVTYKIKQFRQWY